MPRRVGSESLSLRSCAVVVCCLARPSCSFCLRHGNGEQAAFVVLCGTPVFLIMRHRGNRCVVGDRRGRTTPRERSDMFHTATSVWSQSLMTRQLGKTRLLSCNCSVVDRMFSKRPATSLFVVFVRPRCVPQESERPASPTEPLKHLASTMPRGIRSKHVAPALWRLASYGPARLR